MDLGEKGRPGREGETEGREGKEAREGKGSTKGELVRAGWSDLEAAHLTGPRPPPQPRAARGFPPVPPSLPSLAAFAPRLLFSFTYQQLC